MQASQPTARGALAVALLAAMMAGAGCSRKPATTAAGGPPTPPTVVVTPVIQKNVPIYQTFVGQTEASTTIEIRSQVTGLLKEMHFIEGSMVHKGQLLFVIDPQPYQATLAHAPARRFLLVRFQSIRCRLTKKPLEYSYINGCWYWAGWR